MQELYVEGVATHDGPESCVGVREGVGEALTGGRVGQAIEPRNQQFGVPTLFKGRKATSLRALGASPQGIPRGRRTRACTRVSMRENREGPCLPVQAVTGRAVQGTRKRYA